MLCINSPFGRLNFLILSADADAKQFLKNMSKKLRSKENNYIKKNCSLVKETVVFTGTYSVGCRAIARTDFLWCVRVTIVLPARQENQLSSLKTKGKKYQEIKRKQDTKN